PCFVVIRIISECIFICFNCLLVVFLFHQSLTQIMQNPVFFFLGCCRFHCLMIVNNRFARLILPFNSVTCIICCLRTSVILLTIRIFFGFVYFLSVISILLFG